MNKETFLELLLGVMALKDHWAWPAFTSGLVAKERLHFHFEQEYGTYVRDFPLMVGWAYVQCPIAAVRRALAENIYEEETGGLVAGRPHPELFLEYARGLGMDLSRFVNVELLPAAHSYREFLDRAIQHNGWEIAAAVVTIFIEGTKDERGEIDPAIPRQLQEPLAEHPLVKHYGLPVKHLALTKAHRQIEPDHRASAWEILLNYMPAARREAVVSAMKNALAHWLRYRDEVAAVCGIERGPDGRPRFAAG